MHEPLIRYTGQGFLLLQIALHALQGLDCVKLAAMNKSLLSLLSSDTAVSGEALAAHFGCSRAAISKQVEVLRSAGVLLHSRSRVGYQLGYPYQWWSAEQLANLLSSLPLQINLLDSVSSTNTWLRERPQAALCQLAITDWQGAGRGRHEREWLSPPGRQLTFSLRRDVAEGPWPWQGLALAVGVEIAETLQSHGIPVQLKWPNDLWLSGAKLGGILVELDAASDGPSSIIVGVGLNELLTQAERDRLDRPVSDLSAYATTYTRAQLLHELLERLIRLLSEYASRGLGAWIERWHRLDLLRGREVQFEQAGRQVTGIAQGIDAQGCLCVMTADGLLRCHSGEISLGALAGGI